jgi:KaiC/GvpD/RAD55 family RecA-like ATPase
VSDREQVLKEMKETVMNLHSDEQIEQHYVIRGLTEETKIPEKPSRDKIQELGDSLIECTEEVLKSLKRFYT